MKRIIVFLSLFLLACLLPVGVAQATGFSLKTAQRIYKPGDTILVTADLYNDYESEADVVLECLLTSQTKISYDRLVYHPVTLGPGESKTVTLYEIYVTEDFPSDEYRVVVKLVMDNIVEDEREIIFLVEDTLEEMVFGVHLCKDRECEHESSVFIQGDNVYVSYESPINGIQVTGTISFPDESKEQIALPTALQAMQTGSYVLLVTASKERYNRETEEINFAVIEKEPRIPEVLLADSFEDGIADGWELEPGWRVEREDGNYVLSGEGHSWVRLETGLDWTDYSFRFRLKLIRGGIHLNYRVSSEGRYFIGFGEEGVYLNKETPWGNFFDLAGSDAYHRLEVWYDVKIVGEGGHLQVYVDGILKLDYIDDAPLTWGNIAFETLEGSHAYIDDVEVTGLR